MSRRILMTLHQDRAATRADHYAIKYSVDEYDAYDIANGFAALGHEVYFVNWDDLTERDAHGRPGFSEMFAWRPGPGPAGVPEAVHGGFVAPLPLAAMDLLLIYKMEGFYRDLDRFGRLLDVFAAAGPPVVNDPATIRHNLDKRYLLELASRGVRVIPTRRLDREVMRRLQAGDTFVLKPLFGERGTDVRRVDCLADLDDVAGREGDFLAQDFVPTVRRGERSLIYFGFAYQHAILKTPNPEDPREFRCNESLGGRVEVYEPTPAEHDFALGVLHAYAGLGYPVHYSRVDFLVDDRGPLLVEAELINPAIFANYAGRGRELGRKAAEYLVGLARDDRAA